MEQREIKFRGIGVNSNEWVYSMTIAKGVIKRKRDNVYFEVSDKWVGVVPKSVGQYTGLKDTNGVEIYEGDIFLNGESKRIIEFRGGNYHAIKPSRTETILLSFIVGQGNNRVIGNIHQNPELLK